MELKWGGVLRISLIYLFIYFADDCLLLMKDTSNSATILMTILRDYEKASGQKINLQKNLAFFSSPEAWI